MTFRFKDKKRKFKNRWTEIDGKTFPSAAEAQRYLALAYRQQEGEICDLMTQFRFPLLAGIVYIADFVYFEVFDNEWVVEEVKGAETDVWKIKKKLFTHLYPELKLLVTKA